MGKKKCYIYTRVSTAIQVDGYSLDAQTERLREYADYKEYEIAGEYCDAGKSGMSIKGRPEFQNMMNDIVSCKDDISAVLVFKLSRFGRNAADVLKSMQILEDFDISLICVDDAIDSSTQGGKLTMAILSAVAEIEHENITVQFMAARMQKISKGGWPGGPAPFGYRISEKKLVIEETEADLVRTIFDTYLQDGMNTSSTVNVLNEKGILRPDGKVITSDFVRGIVRNPIYFGIIMFNRRSNNPKIKMNPKEVISAKGIHEPIIREETGIGWVKTHSLDHEHILSGIIKCPICGCGMAGTVRRRKNKKKGDYKDDFYYRCLHRKMVGDHYCDFKLSLNQNELNAEVEHILLDMIQCDAFKNFIVKKMDDVVDVSTLESEKEQLKNQLRQVVGAKRKLTEQLDKLDVGDKHYDRKYQDMQDRMDNLYDKISEIEGALSGIEEQIKHTYERHFSAKDLYQILENFDKLYVNMSDLEKKEFFQNFIEYIELLPEKNSDGRILKHIRLKFPVYYNGEEKEDIRLLNGETVETVCCIRRDVK